MYLNPPVNDLKELEERLRNHEVFRVFKRVVRANTKDRTFKRHGRSNVTLENGTEVIVQILNGRIILVEPLNSPTSGGFNFAEPRMKLSEKEKKEEESFRSFLDRMNGLEKATKDTEEK